jgi:hypothetical protein
MKPSLFLLAALAGCVGDDLVPSDPYVPGDSPYEPDVPVEVIRSVDVLADDCRGNVLGAEQVDSFIPGEGNLHIIGIGQTNLVDPAVQHTRRETDASREDLECHALDKSCAEGQAEPASVHVARGVTTLVLASPLPTRWTVTADADSDLHTVIVSGIEGANDSSAIVPQGIRFEKLDLGYAYVHHDEKDLAKSCESELEDPALCAELGDFWYAHRREEAAEARLFLERVEDVVGKIGSFRGCHSMSSMKIGTPKARGQESSLTEPARRVPPVSLPPASKS